MKRKYIILVFLAFFVSVMVVRAEVYQWIDNEGIMHFHNKAPVWWDTEKNVIHHKRVIDKTATLEKLGLPVDSPDFEKSDQSDSTVDISQDGNKLVFSSAKPSEVGTDIPEEGYQPKSTDELSELKPGFVIADLSTHQYHTKECRRILRGYGKRKEYRININQVRIFPNHEAAEKAGFRPCPSCRGGKPR